MFEHIFIQAFIGGMLIGAGAVTLMLFNGRIAGISGIAYGALSNFNTEGLWRWAFILGLIIAPLVTSLWGFTLPEVIPASLTTLAIAGLLVGFGTRLGSGCTSGHGICGLARLSKRSMVATFTFMASAIITVSVIRHLV